MVGIGTFRQSKYCVEVIGEKGTAEPGGGNDIAIVHEICKFFRSGKPPVVAEETTNLLTFIVVAEESRKNGGKPVTIKSIMQKAKHD